MDIKEAMAEMEMIRDIFIDERCVSDEESEDVTKEFEIAFSAMGKQIPKKPVFKNGESVMAVDYADGHGEMKKEKWADWACPCCGWFVGEQYIPRKHNQQKSNFCSRCGQAIDWSKD